MLTRAPGALVVARGDSWHTLGMTKRPATVGIFNSNDDLVRIIRQAIHDEGYLTISAHIVDLRDGGVDLIAFFTQRDPEVVIYDIAPPYEIAWQFLTLLQALPVMKGRGLVLTTVNKAAAERALGKQGFLEVVGTERDVRAVIDAVNQLARRRRGSIGRAPSQPKMRTSRARLG